MTKIFKHDSAIRFINLFLKSECEKELDPILLKVVIEKLLQYLELRHGIKVRRK